MARLGTEINIKVELRPCIVKDRKALFHKWSQSNRVVMTGEVITHVIKNTIAIIEYENGAVTECYPYEIKFTDNKHREYCFGAEEGLL